MQNRPDLAIALERVTMVAVAAMERRRRAMWALPLLVGSDELRGPLRGLAAWYERLCVDEDFSMAPPAEGIEVLPRVAQLTTGSPAVEVAIAWWAVRVAEEVVACRQLLGCAHDADGASLGAALSQLEIALHGWRQHMSRATA